MRNDIFAGQPLFMMRIVGFFCLVVFLGSCVANKKVTLMQNGDLKASVQVDTVVRTYALDTFQYRIQPNDILSIRYESKTAKELDVFATQQSANQNMVQGNPLLMGELVDEDGNIPFPVLGKLKVSDLTLFEVQEKIQQIANRYVDSPIVKVRLMNYRLTVLGEVKTEGNIILNNNRVSMLEALGLAGGLGDLADRTKVKLIRQRGAKTEVVYLNLLDENFVRSPYYYVYQNDVLIVPALKQRPFRKYFGENVNAFNATVGVVSSITVLILTLNLINN